MPQGSGKRLPAYATLWGFNNNLQPQHEEGFEYSMHIETV